MLQVAVGLLGLLYVALIYPLYTDLGRLSGGHQQKGAERDEPTKKHRVAFVFLFQKPLGIR